MLHGGAVTALVHPDSQTVQLGRQRLSRAEGGQRAGERADVDGPTEYRRTGRGRFIMMGGAAELRRQRQQRQRAACSRARAPATNYG